MANLNNEYNDIPVHYCPKCLSLKIMWAGVEDISYCDNCGSSETSETDIWKWRSMYYKKYRKNFIDYPDHILDNERFKYAYDRDLKVKYPDNPLMEFEEYEHDPTSIQDPAYNDFEEMYNEEIEYDGEENIYDNP
jgi:hypothetical protein